MSKSADSTGKAKAVQTSASHDGGVSPGGSGFSKHKPAEEARDEEGGHAAALSGAKLLSAIANEHVKHLHSLNEARKAKRQAKAGLPSQSETEESEAGGHDNPQSGDIGDAGGR